MILRLTFPIACTFASLGATAVQADLRACNRTGDVVSVAIGYSDDGVWTSEGWWTVRPGDCATMIAGDLRERYYYWRATVDRVALPTENYHFCTSPTVFTIVGDEDCEARGFDSSAFNVADVGQASSHTIEVTVGGSGGGSDGLEDIRANLQGRWQAVQDGRLEAVISGRDLTLSFQGEMLDTLGFDVGQTCPAAEGDGPVLLIDPPVEDAPPSCWLLVNSSRDGWSFFIYETGEEGTFERQR